MNMNMDTDENKGSDLIDKQKKQLVYQSQSDDEFWEES
jgi:hypothetical protein